MIRAAVFDYGDTLVHHRIPFAAILPGAVRAAYLVFAEAGFESTFEEFRSVNDSVFAGFAEAEAREDRDIPDTTKYNELARRLFPAKPVAWRRMIANSANREFHDFGAKYRLVGRGARSSLEELKSMGLKMAVLSNHSDQGALERGLKQFELDSYFFRVFSSSELGVRKPDPRAFAKCIASLRVRADKTVFVGDSLKNDIAGAKACGMTAVFVDHETNQDVPSGAPTPDFSVTTLSGIPGIIRRLNSARG
ncbi:MAG: HAD family hydrolase [Nitrososphaerota archaeon]|nr:HAD family hydrolase [Nitrososphaerota archaeon]MDG7010785.1 HAD family hydrolase [Nitrososphaerota archaeon]